MFDKMRKNAFWVFDAIKGGGIRSNYQQINKINSNPYSKYSVKKRQENLKKLLRYSIEETVFYSSVKNEAELKNFPVIDKSIVRDSYSDFIGRNVELENLKKVTTSGSTGTPFTIHQDGKKRLRHTADNIYFNELAGMPLGKKLYYFRIWNDVVYRNRLKNYLQNIVPVESSKLDFDTIDKSILSKILNDSDEKALLAYASTYEALVKALSSKYSKPFDANVISIMSMSETLPKHIKEKLEFYFSCEAVSRYSNMENGFIGQQVRKGAGEYSINMASYEIEILDLNKDIPAGIGEMGRIVVTDLFNYAMPLIRYDTGDVASLIYKQIDGVKLPFFNRIEGRKVDFITDTEGNLISPHTVTNSMWKFPSIKQFQFIQNDRNRYVLVINSEKNDQIPDMEILKELKKYVGRDANIKVEFVEEVPLLASGKRKKVVNNYQKFD